MTYSESQVIPFSGREPRIGDRVFLAAGARVVGDVRLGDRVSIWFNAVLRGDIHRVEIGAGTNIQDNATCHVDDDYPCIVGRDVVVGHAAILHGCTVADRCLIGMSATLLNGATVGEGAVVAAGTLVPEGKEIPAHHLVMGLGAKIMRPLPEDFWEPAPQAASKYRRLADSYMTGADYRWPDEDWDRRDAAEVAARPES
jgi:carbonic anhydrase/acetyltransferase-like protein (isoleucine patch superfamily)